MARAARKTKRSKKTYRAKGRPPSKVESPEMRTGNEGLSIHNYSSFPKAVKNRFVDGYEAAKAAYASGAFNVSGQLTTAKRKSARKSVFDHVRATGTEREQLYLNEPNDPGKAYRQGIRSGVQVIWDEEGSGRSAYGARDNPMRRRRNSVSIEVYAQARRGGLKDRQIRQLAKYARGEKAGSYPNKMSQLKRDHDGNAYWPVRTVHDTHWHYTIKKFKSGYVVEFRRRDGQSNRHYITPNNTQSSKKAYYRTKTDAFKALKLHAYSGHYAKFRNPRRRR